MHPPSDASPSLALVVASDADVRAYVRDALAEGLPATFDVVPAASTSAALEAAGARAPAVLVVADADRALLRHLPGVPAVLLADDTPAFDPRDTGRSAPLVVLRGAFGAPRLCQVVTWVMAWGRLAPPPGSPRAR